MNNTQLQKTESSLITEHFDMSDATTIKPIEWGTIKNKWKIVHKNRRFGVYIMVKRCSDTYKLCVQTSNGNKRRKFTLQIINEENENVLSLHTFTSLQMYNLPSDCVKKGTITIHFRMIQVFNRVLPSYRSRKL